MFPRLVRRRDLLRDRSVSWGLALYGSSVYLQVLSTSHGWPLSDVSAAVSAMYLVGASLQRPSPA